VGANELRGIEEAVKVDSNRGERLEELRFCRFTFGGALGGSSRRSAQVDVRKLVGMARTELGRGGRGEEEGKKEGRRSKTEDGRNVHIK
jgi:hypothetical protein